MTKNQTRKFFIYARKSTDTEDRQVRSIGDQISELLELAQKENVEIVDTIVEKQTAKKPGRPMFADMLKRLEAGEAVGILAWHPDRLARNSVDGGQIIYLVDTGVIQELKFPTFWFDPTPQGKFMLSIAFGQSKYYVDNLSENIKRGHRQKLKQGLWPQMAPLGYLNNRETKQIYLDKEKAPLIKKTFEAYASGNYTLKNLRKIINGLGLRGRRGGMLSTSNFQYLLQNPFYYGVIRYNGEFYEGKHEPIITKKLFDEVQEVMARKSKPQKADTMKFFLYRGFFKCGECGYTITADEKVKPSGKSYTYYYCTRKNPRHTCSQKVFTREEKISSELTTELQKVSLPDDCTDWMLEEIEKERKATSQSSRSFAQKHEAELSKLDEKLEKLMTAYLESVLNVSEYQEAKNKLINQKQVLKDKLSAFEQKSNNRFELATRFVKDANQAKIIASKENPEGIRDFLKKIGSNFQIQNQAVSFSPRGAWQSVANWGLGAPCAPAEARSAEAIFSQNAEIVNWRRGWDSNPRYPYEHFGFQDRRLRPLSHPSLSLFKMFYSMTVWTN